MVSTSGASGTKAGRIDPAGDACVFVAPRTGNAMVGANAVNGETLREVLQDARELPGAAEIAALETAALSEAGKACRGRRSARSA